MNTEHFGKRRCSTPPAQVKRMVVLQQIQNGWIAYWAAEGINKSTVHAGSIWSVATAFEELHKINLDSPAWNTECVASGRCQITEA